MKVRVLFNYIASFFFPVRCIVCKNYVADGSDVCDICRRELHIKTGQFCYICGRVLSDCKCSKERFDFLRVISPYDYEDEIRDIMLAYKYHKRYRLADLFAEEMAELIRREYHDVAFDYITFVPRSRKNIISYGYDQSMLLADRIGKLLGLKSVPLLKNAKSKGFQHFLSKEQRKKNVCGKYKLCVKPEMIKKRNILVCDDIITTGSTLNEVSKVLHRAGAEDIFCVTAASAR